MKPLSCETQRLLAERTVAVIGGPYHRISTLKGQLGEYYHTRVRAVSATNAHISVLGHITEEELASAMTDTEATDGFANRFLWLMVHRSKSLPHGGGNVDLSQVASKLDVALQFAHGYALKPNTAAVQRDAAVDALWEPMYTRLTADKPGLVGAITARGEVHVLRLSLIYAALDQSDVVRPEHLRAAEAVWNYSEESAKYIFGDRSGNAVADEILELLKLRGAEGANRTAISNHFGRNLSADRLQSALQTLQRAGLVEQFLEEGQGRPRTVFIAVS